MFDKNRFRAQIVLRGMTYGQVASMLDINESTLYRKIQRDGDFTRDEINKLISGLKIDDPGAIFFANELAETQDNVTI